MKAAIIGGGVIGGGWAARFALNGWDVAIVDPDPEAFRKTSEVLANARRALPALYAAALPPEGPVRFTDNLADACTDADWVQESVPERLDIKQGVHAQLTAIAPENSIIGSSTSGFKPSELTARGARVIVAHPFNPVYLLPLVELVGDPDTCARAADILRVIGMYPLPIRKEIDAHIADRLLEAVWREALWLVRDGIATTREIDDSIRMGFGLRWAQMGLFETYRVAGGEAGMRHFMAQFGPALKWPWSKLTDVPEFNDALIDMIAGQSDAQSGHLGIRELERLRDDNLVGIMRALKPSGSGAGGVITRHEAALVKAASPKAASAVTLDRQIPQASKDHDGLMNEAHFLEAGSTATDCFMELIGADADYVAKGRSYFTVENHLRYLGEVHTGDTLRSQTQLLEGTGKRLHLFHTLTRGDGTPVATVESLLLHMDLTMRKTCFPGDMVAKALARMAEAQKGMPQPEGSGQVER